MENKELNERLRKSIQQSKEGKVSSRDSFQNKCDYPGCNGIHIPNEETERVLRETDRGENLEHFETVEELIKSLELE